MCSLHYIDNIGIDPITWGTYQITRSEKCINQIVQQLTISIQEQFNNFEYAFNIIIDNYIRINKNNK